MKKLLAMMAFALPLSANASDFTGLSVWVGGQYTDGETKYFDKLDNSRTDFDDTDTGLTIGADYGFALTDNSVLLVGVSWADKADIASLDFVNDGGDASTISAESEQSYMFYVAPGYKIGESSLLYAKLSYSEAEGTLTVDNNVDGTSFSSRGIDDKAFGYGLGFRSYVTENVFLNADVERVEYEYSVSDFEATIDTPITRASITVGMSF